MERLERIRCVVVWAQHANSAHVSSVRALFILEGGVRSAVPA